MSVFYRQDCSPEWNQLCPEWYVDPNLPEEERRFEFFARRHAVGCGETEIIRVKFLFRDRIVIGEKVKFCLERDFHEPQEWFAEQEEGGFRIPVTLEKPGFVRLTATARDFSKAYGIGFDVHRIAPAPEVENFDEYWANQRKRLAAVPLKELSREKLSLGLPEYEGIDSYNVSVSSVDGTPVQAILSKKAGAKAKSLPAYVCYHGAGIRPAFPPLPWAKKGFLALNVSALGIPYGKDAAFYAQTQKDFANYPAKRSANPEELYFNDMALRVIRSLEYLKSQREWDGKTLIVHGGSQGGWQSLVACAFDHDVTFASIEAPANCNVAGAMQGRIQSWPHTIHRGDADTPETRASRLMDGVAFARRGIAPAVFTVGFSDGAAVPSSVFAAYKVYGGPKDLRCYTDLGHELAVFWSNFDVICEKAGLL